MESYLYTEDFYKAQQEGSRKSAREIIPLVLEILKPQSVIDVGCGVGTWLSVFKEFGIKYCLGIDGDYIDKNMLQILPVEFLSCDCTSFTCKRLYMETLQCNVSTNIYN